MPKFRVRIRETQRTWEVRWPADLIGVTLTAFQATIEGSISHQEAAPRIGWMLGPMSACRLPTSVRL
jgi:hypothetical protein